jgi:hypothetical protein
VDAHADFEFVLGAARLGDFQGALDWG